MYSHHPGACCHWDPCGKDPGKPYPPPGKSRGHPDGSKQKAEFQCTGAMLNNVDKCEVMHFGRRNQKSEYYLSGERLQVNEVHRNLGVLVHESQQASKQVQQVVQKANYILAFIAKRFEFKTRGVLLQLYTVLVRPHLEYCVQFCSLYLIKDIVTLEAVQRRFTRLIPGMRGLSYQERLNSLGLYSLQFETQTNSWITIPTISHTNNTLTS